MVTTVVDSSLQRVHVFGVLLTVLLPPIASDVRRPSNVLQLSEPPRLRRWTVKPHPRLHHLDEQTVMERLWRTRVSLDADVHQTEVLWVRARVQSTGRIDEEREMPNDPDRVGRRRKTKLRQVREDTKDAKD